MSLASLPSTATRCLMKRSDEVSTGAQRPSMTVRRPRGVQVFQIHPVPASRNHVLLIAMHLARRFATLHGKSAPEFSEDAAVYLAHRRWAIGDLAPRVARAVAANCGSLITAADLMGA